MSKSMAFRDACMSVIHANIYGCYAEQAKAYAKLGLSLTTQDEMSSQAYYMLSNLRYWQGSEARRVKETLKRFK